MLLNVGIEVAKRHHTTDPARLRAEILLENISRELRKEPDYAPKRIAGVTHDNRQATIRNCRAGMPVQFVREPSNPHDPNAVIVKARGKMVGYLPADIAEWAAKNIDSGHRKYKSRVAEVWTFDGDDGREIWMLNVTMEVWDLMEVDAWPSLAEVASGTIKAVGKIVVLSGSWATRTVVPAIRRFCL